VSQVKEIARLTDILVEDDAVAEVEDVLRRLAGRRVRLRCRDDVPYENPLIGRVERVTTGQVVVRVHPTRIDGIPISDIVGVDVLTEDE
jgi:hypothetical protein